jgi:1-acyl-sn-glycerol-3-phosphate acyltransferase
MKKIIDWLFTIFFIIVFFLVLLILHPIQIICTLFGYRGTAAASHAFMWSVVQSVRATGASFHIRHREYLRQIPKNRPIIIVSNHQSEFEIAVIGWYVYITTGHHCKFISKKELQYGIPSISWILRHSHHAIINRADRKQALESIDEFAAIAQKNNYAACIFVEGTRSKNGILKPFKTAGFTQLFDNMPNAAVITVTLENFYKTKRIPIQSFLPLRLTFSEPIERGNQNAEEILKICEQRIKIQLGQ